MKILAIRGRNLASLEGEFEVDFAAEPLLSAGIFAISGPTGAGKSTILDAMCLALFARTPRTDQAKENNVKLRDVNEEVLPQSDPRFLLRRGTASGYAEVDFVALNGHRYRARWSVGRARDKENGRLQSPRITLHTIDNEKEEQGTRSELQVRITELIGLTFDQFTRSVLLAQNDFSTFLKAEQGEKASLLEKLTGTEQYSAISRLIFEKNAIAKEAYDKLQNRIQGVELLTEETEKELNTRLAETEKIHLRLEKAKTEQQALREAVRSAEQQISTKQTQHKEATEQLIRSTSLLTTARKEYEQGAEEQQKSETLFKALQAEIRQARKLDIQLDAATQIVSDSDRQYKNALVRKKEGEDKWKVAVSRQQRGTTEIKQLTDWRERYRSKESIAEQFSALLIHLDAASAARLTVEKADRAIAAARQAFEQLATRIAVMEQTAEKKRITLRQIENELQQIESLQKETDIAAIEKNTAACRERREQLLIEQAQFVTTGDIKALRDKLTEGVPCPVCGSPHHPYSPHEVNERLLALAKDVSDITLQIGKLTKQAESYAAGQKQLARLQQQQLVLHKELAESGNFCADLLGQQKLSASQITHEEATITDGRDTLKYSLSAANRLFGNDEWQRGWQQDPDTFRETLATFARKWHDNGEKLQQLELQQSGWKAESDSLASFLPSLEKQSDEAFTLYDKNKKTLAALQTERAGILSGKPADRVEQEHTRRIEELSERLKRLLATQTEQSGIAEQSRGIVGQIEKDLAEAFRILELRKGALTVWTATYKESEGVESLEEALLRVNREKSEIGFRLRTHNENRQKIASLQGELEACRMGSERWAKLNDLAGSADGAKFRRIAQGYTLDVLLSYTNVQLRDLTRRYRLERVPETLALQVIDQDMCDEVRTVHSLSGGESFLVSLALALGLSSLSSNRMKVESLFIDEGFGSLDADTLRVAMDALESLRTQGRKIGVISHVQEMTERIPVQIRVSRAGNGRSYLEVV